MSRSLFKSTFLVSLMTMLSRVFGFVRDLVSARFFGAGAEFDAFMIAFRAPNLLRGLFAEGAFLKAFVPVLSEYREKEGRERTQALIARTMTLLMVASLLSVLLLEFLAPLIIGMLAPGIWGETARFALATHLLRITLPFITFITLTAFTGAVLNCYGYFGVAAFSPVLLNLSIVCAVVWGASYFSIPVEALAWGVSLGGALQLAFQLPALYRRGLLPRFQWMWRDEGMRKIFKLLLPALMGGAVGRLGVLVDTIFASYLVTGSISWLYYSERLVFFPAGVFGVALATVVLPHLSRKYAGKEKTEFSQSLDWGLRCVYVIGLPAAVGLLMMAGPLLSTLFQYGAFDEHAVRMSTRSLMTFSVGLLPFMLVKVLGTGFYSRQEVKIPVIIATLALLTNIILNAIFIVPLAHAGLALATSIAAWLNAGLLFYNLKRKGIYRPTAGWQLFGLQLLLGNFVLAAFLYWGVPSLKQWLVWSGVLRVEHLLLWIVGAMAIYFVTLFVSGVRLSHFRSSKTIV